MEERKTTLTVEEAIETVIRTLEDINVPIRYADEIARPISGAVGLLKSCQVAIQGTGNPEEGGDADGESNGISV